MTLKLTTKRINKTKNLIKIIKMMLKVQYDSSDAVRLARSKEFTNVIFQSDSHPLVQAVRTHRSVELELFF